MTEIQALKQEKDSEVSMIREENNMYIKEMEAKIKQLEKALADEKTNHEIEMRNLQDSENKLRTELLSTKKQIQTRNENLSKIHTAEGNCKDQRMRVSKI